MTMKCEYPTRWLLAGLLLAPLLLGGCSIEHIHEPWVNAEQRELLEGQIERDEGLEATRRAIERSKAIAGQ